MVSAAWEHCLGTLTAPGGLWPVGCNLRDGGTRPLPEAELGWPSSPGRGGEESGSASTCPGKSALTARATVRDLA